MDPRTNASTDDLLTPDAIARLSDESDATFPGVLSLDVGASTSHSPTPKSSPRPSPKPSPEVNRRRRPTLRLNFDEATWAPAKTIRSPTALRFRQNLQSGAAKISSAMRQSQTPEFRFRVILLLLFGSIVALVTFTWYFYQKQLLLVVLGDRIRFHEGQRIMHLLNRHGNEVLQGILGQSIPGDLFPYDCQVLHPEAPNICVEWKYRARLWIQYLHDKNLTCYNVYWISLAHDTHLKDCYDLRDAFWYGMGEIHNLSWPLLSLSQKFRPFVTGELRRDAFGSILERYWLSSAGVAIYVNPNVPLYVSVNETGKQHLCIGAKYDGFPYLTGSPKLPFLNYTICTSENIKTVHEGIIRKFRPYPKKLISSEILEKSMWSTSPKLQGNMTQEAIKEFADQIVTQDIKPGYFVIDTRWQKEIGDFEFRSQNFTDPTEILRILKHKGFNVILQIHPYICLASDSFKKGAMEKVLIEGTVQHVPLLTRWKSTICGVIDVTKNVSADWFLERLERIRMRYGIDGFLFTGGQSSYLPQTYSIWRNNFTPDSYIKDYLTLASKTSSLMGTSVGCGTQQIPAFITLSPRTSTWDNATGLGSIIPNVLTLGLLGYPVINPGSVGGDIFANNETVPEKELFRRWSQLAAFMPVVQFSVLPTVYGMEVARPVKVLWKSIRIEKVVPVMQKCLQEHLENSAPIIRPLWWLSPNDTNAHTAESQFVVGIDIIVAPIVEKGKFQRDIYLPPGWWRDEIMGQPRKGDKWIHNYPIPQDKVAYFTRMESPT